MAVIHLHKPGRFGLLGIVFIMANGAAAGDIAFDVVRNDKVAVILLDSEVQQALAPKEILAEN
jgi:hypothetical protein